MTDEYENVPGRHRYGDGVVPMQRSGRRWLAVVVIVVVGLWFLAISAAFHSHTRAGCGVDNDHSGATCGSIRMINNGESP